MHLLSKPNRVESINFWLTSTLQAEEEPNVNFEPVIRLTQQVETKTMEEDEDQLFKMCVQPQDTHGRMYVLTRLSGARSFSASMPVKAHGRNAVLVMSAFCSTEKIKRSVWL